VSAGLAVAALVTLALVPLSATASPEPFRSSIRPLSARERTQLVRAGAWHPACPVGLSGLRVLRVRYVGLDGRARTGQLVVGRDVASPLVGVFRRLYELRFRVRHLQFRDMYGPKGARPPDGDVSGSFECRQAVPSPCSGGRGTGTWSNHAYGHAIDLNPRENPYVGCGRTRDRKSRTYLDRTRLRPGMVTPAVVAAFRSIGWGWGGAWTGDTRDYMHFSVNGR
jgi:hypothetical protein